MLSVYELQRLATIKANWEVLVGLGLQSRVLPPPIVNEEEVAAARAAQLARRVAVAAQNAAIVHGRSKRTRSNESMADCDSEDEEDKAFRLATLKEAKCTKLASEKGATRAMKMAKKGKSAKGGRAADRTATDATGARSTWQSVARQATAPMGARVPTGGTAPIGARGAWNLAGQGDPPLQQTLYAHSETLLRQGTACTLPPWYCAPVVADATARAQTAVTRMGLCEVDAPRPSATMALGLSQLAIRANAELGLSECDATCATLGYALPGACPAAAWVAYAVSPRAREPTMSLEICFGADGAFPFRAFRFWLWAAVVVCNAQSVVRDIRFHHVESENRTVYIVYFATSAPLADVRYAGDAIWKRVEAPGGTAPATSGQLSPTACDGLPFVVMRHVVPHRRVCAYALGDYATEEAAYSAVALFHALRCRAATYRHQSDTRSLDLREAVSTADLEVLQFAVGAAYQQSPRGEEQGIVWTP
jgi:hypothetical protein